MRERRGASRISTDLTARWDGEAPPHEGRVIDLSASGCFILTAGQVPSRTLSRVNQLPSNQALRLEVQLSPDEPLGLRAEVVYTVERVGFAARFVDLTPRQEQTLRAYIERHERERAGPKPHPFTGAGKGRGR